jgi:predicted RND superfamily exporter protein
MRAVLASGLTTIASFGNLAFSAHAGTASMGVLLALGLVTSMAATLVVLPAWLARAGRREARA